MCVDSLAFGNYGVRETSPPSGYKKDTGGQAVNVNNNAKCADDPYVGETAPFTDTPLTDLTVNATAQSDGVGTTGATESSSGAQLGTTLGSRAPTSVTHLTRPPGPRIRPRSTPTGSAGTYTCEVVIDP